MTMDYNFEEVCETSVGFQFYVHYSLMPSILSSLLTLLNLAAFYKIFKEEGFIFKIIWSIVLGFRSQSRNNIPQHDKKFGKHIYIFFRFPFKFVLQISNCKMAFSALIDE